MAQSEGEYFTRTGLSDTTDVSVILLRLWARLNAKHSTVFDKSRRAQAGALNTSNTDKEPSRLENPPLPDSKGIYVQSLLGKLQQAPGNVSVGLGGLGGLRHQHTTEAGPTSALAELHNSNMYPLGSSQLVGSSCPNQPPRKIQAMPSSYPALYIYNFPCLLGFCAIHGETHH